MGSLEERVMSVLAVPTRVLNDTGNAILDTLDPFLPCDAVVLLGVCGVVYMWYTNLRVFLRYKRQQRAERALGERVDKSD